MTANKKTKITKTQLDTMIREAVREEIEFLSDPNLDTIVMEIADMAARAINEKVRNVESPKIMYKAQYVLEELIRELQRRV